MRWRRTASVLAQRAAVGAATVAAGVDEGGPAGLQRADAQPFPLGFHGEDGQSSRGHGFHTALDVLAVRCEVQMRAQVVVRGQVHASSAVREQSVDRLAPFVLRGSLENGPQTPRPRPDLLTGRASDMRTPDRVLLQCPFQCLRPPGTTRLEIYQRHGQVDPDHVVMFKLHSTIATHAGIRRTGLSVLSRRFVGSMRRLCRGFRRRSLSRRRAVDGRSSQ